mgnify:CR=1 FL=1
MADTVVAAAVAQTQWADDYLVEYVRLNPFNDSMGDSVNDIIQVKEDLMAKPGVRGKGVIITFQLVKRLTGAGVSNDAQLRDNEEELDNAAMSVTVNQIRQGVTRGEYEQQKTNIPISAASREVLKMWSADQDRDLIIARALTPVVDSITTYGNATEAQKDAWETANNPTDTNQRILFGTAMANSTLDHSAGLSTIDSTNDDLHQDIVSIAKRLAQTCSPRIRPVKMKDGGEEWFTFFVGTRSFRDLRANMATILQNSAPRSLEDNPLYRDKDLVWDGVIIKEVPEMSRVQAATNGGSMITGVGASSIDVEAGFFCGAQAVFYGISQRLAIRTDDYDYGNKSGVAVVQTRGAAKASFDTIQHSVVTVYTSAVAD